MASSSTRRGVVLALNSLLDDGSVFPSADTSSVEALINDYFNGSDDSANGSDDDEDHSKFT